MHLPYLSTSALLVLLSATSQTLAANYFHGITASNSAPNSGAYRCRTQAEWNDLARTARSNGFSSLRILGFDCNALDLASSAAASAGITVLAGIYFSNLSWAVTDPPRSESRVSDIQGTVAANLVQINNEVQVFRAAVGKYGAGRYKGLTIGNEVADDPGLIAAKVADVRGYLGSIGINTPVSTVHTWVAVRDSPQAFCIGDFVGANAHAFYDGNVVGGDAGSFLFNTVIPSLRRACPGKPIIISESGWPSRGGSNGRAVASPAEEYAAIRSLNCAAKNDRSVNVYAFEADDQTWKGNDNERSFGLFGKVRFEGDINNAC
ncbi:glycoside hydrolase [Coprinellus micaceus]|uniref:glucan endo-1,3-beta-D-glucosidase n=1 Tax=Coprinellus micaceus TaxID=71717 RepID=A0A4Y7TS57_COPMI|nr:glycoside hydrolase [Coprinellus micaceus]